MTCYQGGRSSPGWVATRFIRIVASRTVKQLLVKRACWLTLASIHLLLPAQLRAITPSLYIAGIPCPGGEGEPNNTHALVWQCRCAYDSAKLHYWVNWQDTVRVDYG